MSAPNKQTGKAPRHRSGLRGARKPIYMQMRMGQFKRLLELAEDGEPYIAVIERLIDQARPAKRLCV